MEFSGSFYAVFSFALSQRHCRPITSLCASHARTLSCRGHARCSQALAVAQARPLQPHDHALPTWLAGAPPLPSLHGDGGRLKKKLTCGAHTSMSGKREVVGVKRSFDLFYRGFQARCHAGMSICCTTSAKVTKT